MVLTIFQYQAKAWDAGFENISTVDAAAFDDQPALYYVSGIAHLLQAVPWDLRHVPSMHVPFDAREFPLASDTAAREYRQTAEDCFRRAAKHAFDFGADEAGINAEQFELWLGLRHPLAANRERARERLKDKLRGSRSLYWVPLALQFGLPIDPTSTEREIERQGALAGGELPVEAAAALLALAFTQPTPKDAAEYIEKHRPRLVKELDGGAIASFQAQLLALAGEREAAESLLNEQVPSEVADRLRSILQPTPDARAEALELEFAKSDSTGALGQLTDLYERSGPADKFVHYAELLHSRTRSLEDAERLAEAYIRANRWSELSRLLASYAHSIAESLPLTSAAAWQHFWEGDLAEAETLAQQLRQARDVQSDRFLVASLAIASGRWEALLPFVEEEWSNRNSRSTTEQLWAGRLAQAVRSPRAKEFVVHAVSGSEDPHVLLAGYGAATQGGWEDFKEASNWLLEAASRSGEDGPVQRASLAELLERQPDWDKHVDNVWRQLRRGEMPLLVATHGLRKTLIEMQLLPLVTNGDLADVRHRAVVPLFSGVRQQQIDNPQTVSFDVTALFTLGALGLLGEALDSFDRVVLPHNIFGWLFEERQQAAFHQPSRMAAAHALKQLIITKKITAFRAAGAPDEAIIAEVGRDLASMLDAALHENGQDRQHIVVKPGPVHRAGSLLEEKADLSRYSGVIGGCLPIVERLRSMGGITAGEYDVAKAYLQLQEQPWPDQPIIQDGAVLYLDDVAVAYFQHTKILGKLASAGFAVRISAREDAEADALITFEAAEAKIETLLTELRQIVGERLETGKVRLAPARSRNQVPQDVVDKHPTTEAIRLANAVDAVVTDDRFVNRHRQMENEKGGAPIWTTIDVLDRLQATGELNRGRWLEARARLRKAGAALVPLDSDELAELLHAAGVTGDNQNETAELRAIRENLLLTLMKGWLNLPLEAQWIDAVMISLAVVLRAQWNAHTEPTLSQARTRWIMQLMDIRRWASAFAGSEGHLMARLGNVIALTRMVMAPAGINGTAAGSAFEKFVEEEVLRPLEMQDPPLLSALVQHLRRLILASATRDLDCE